jgi:hypothetical protein
VVDAVIAARRVAVALVKIELLAKRLVVEALVEANNVVVPLINLASVEKSSVEVA